MEESRCASSGRAQAASLACDIAIVGGGMVGATLAASLAQRFGADLRIAVIEREKVAKAPSTFDLRSIVLSRSTVRFLHQQGWWQGIAPDAMPIKTVAVERARQFGRLRFTAAEAQVPALGYVIANYDLGAHLWSQVQQQPSVQVLDACQLVSASPQANGWSLSLAPVLSGGDKNAGVNLSQHGDPVETCLRAKLLVVADGAGSSTLKSLGVASQVEPYGQSALVLGLTETDWDQAVALERFLPGGDSVAVLPRGQDRVGVVLATAPAQAAAYLELPDAELLAAVAERLGVRAGKLGKCLQRACYPLSASTAQEIVRSNLLVVGNAAQTLHPIAGQGFNLAVRDLATFLQMMSSCFSGRQRLLVGEPSGEPVGSVAATGDLMPLHALQAYAAKRQGDRQRIKQFCHHLLRVFAWENEPLSVCRQLGLVLFDTLPAGKAWLAHSTLAPRVGPQPVWMSGVAI